MKKMIRVFAVAMVLAMVCVFFASCAPLLSGTYSAELNIGVAGAKTSYTFSGSKVTVTSTASAIIVGSTTTEYKGTYEITEATDGTMSITFTFEDEEASSYVGTKSFAQDKDAGTITIGGITFTKQK